MKEQVERNKRICELRKQGKTLRAIAEEYGFNIGWIYQIVKREKLKEELEELRKSKGV